MKRLRRLRRNWEISQHPAVRFAPPGHFYSPLPDLEVFDQPSNAVYETSYRELPGIELNVERQLKLLQDLLPYMQAFPWKGKSPPKARFNFDQHFFGQGDAIVLYSMLRHLKPSRIIEVGSGFSSALMLDTRDQHPEWQSQFTFIEPFPDRLNSLLRETDRAVVQLIESPVQLVDMKLFQTLQEGDLLFIDSSHVSKIGSDANLLFFEVLPMLSAGVYVHVHDIFWPFEYPVQWIREGRAWNEAYLLRAFLMFNSAFEICLWNSLVANKHNDWMRQNSPLFLENTGGSFYMCKR